MYEDNLYLSNLYEYLEQPVPEQQGLLQQGLQQVSLHLKPGDSLALVGENIGAGDMSHFEDRRRWQEAAEKGMAATFIDKLPEQYDTQLSKWFKGGRELSGGKRGKQDMFMDYLNLFRGR